MKKTFYIIWSKLLTIIGDIKVFKWPFWLVYDPDDYQVTGKQALKILNTLEKGDIILRGYTRYLDGYFIPSFQNDKIGKGFSHGAIYIGNNKIIHAVAEGVSEINAIDFLQCDRIAIFRPKSGQDKAIKIAKKCVKNNIPYDFGFKQGISSLYCFELCHECYPKLDIKTKKIVKLFGLFRQNIYVAQSFVESKELKLVYCWNPKSRIFFKA